MRIIQPTVVVPGDNAARIMARSPQFRGVDIDSGRAVWVFGFLPDSEAALAYGVSAANATFLWVLSTIDGETIATASGFALALPDEFQSVIDRDERPDPHDEPGLPMANGAHIREDPHLPDLANARNWLDEIRADLYRARAALAGVDDEDAQELCGVLDAHAATLGDIVARGQVVPTYPTLTVPDPDGLAVHYTPWFDGYAIGFKVTRADGAIEYIYFNPSDNEDGSDDPNVFVYSGMHGEADKDGAHHFYVQDFEAWEAQEFPPE